jgi:hypothetical protein
MICRTCTPLPSDIYSRNLGPGSRRSSSGLPRRLGWMRTFPNSLACQVRQRDSLASTCSFNCLDSVSGRLGHISYFPPSSPFALPSASFLLQHPLSRPFFATHNDRIHISVILFASFLFVRLQVQSPATGRKDHFLCDLDFSADPRSLKGRNPRALQR